MSNIPKYGNREQVFNGEALMTKGKITKENLVYDEKSQKYKSVKAIQRGKDLSLQIKAKKEAQPLAEEIALLKLAEDALSLKGEVKPSLSEELMTNPAPEPFIVVKPKRSRKPKVVN